MNYIDAVGKSIEIGSYITYPKTGTVGKVQDLKEENGTYWVKIDKPELWYASDVIEVIDESNVKDKHNRSKRDLDVEDIKNSNEMNVEISSEVGEGGG